MRRFEFVEGSSSKYWAISRSGATLTVQWGRLGTEGQQKVTEFDSEDAAEAAEAKLIAEMTRMGYQEVEGSGSNDQTSDFPPEFLALARSAFLPEFAAAKTYEPLASRFGGSASLRRGEPWPRCGECQGFLSPVLQLNLAKLPTRPDGLPASGLVQVFYCYREDICDDNWEAFSKAHSCRLIPESDFRSLSLPGEPPDVKLFEARVITGWQRVEHDFPHGEEDVVRDLDLDAEDLDNAMDSALNLPHMGKDKLLGWPAFVQGTEYPDCPTCKSSMTYLMQIESEKGLDAIWGDWGNAMVFYCKSHPEILALNWACS